MPKNIFSSRQVLAAGVMSLAALSLFLGNTPELKAQSGSRSGLKGKVALEGYCPVCAVKMKKWMRGNSKYQATYDGQTYYFPGEKQKGMFLADPAKYVPVLGGNCTVCYAKMGKMMPGDIRHAFLHQHRLFLFPGADQKKEFVDNMDKYKDVDLAFGGNCAVCQVEMKKEVPGKPEVSTIYQGFRYLFPSDKQRQMFLSNPTKYSVKSKSNKQSSTNKTAAHLVSITGKSGCAGCDHGVKPIGDPDELGLAVSADDGNVYVIENAHKLYPSVYEKRFSGLSLAVSGRVLKRQGKITWIEPTKLSVVN